MRAIIVDDEAVMIRRFIRLSHQIPDLKIIGQFKSAEEAIAFAAQHTIDIAFLDIEMPDISGIELAQSLREIRNDMLIVFITAFDEYVRDANLIGGDFYIVKPYNLKTLNMAMERLRLLAHRQRKQIFIQTFGRFVVFKDNKPIRLTGKAKEILALLVAHRGKEVSNEEIYGTIWENRHYSNSNMVVYYNALRRLKQSLERAGVSELLVSGARGQMLDTSLYDCDYYSFLEKSVNPRDRFEGEFLSEYSWSEYLMGPLLNID